MANLGLQPIDQMYAEGQAVAQDPTLARPEGWAQREVLLTLGALASGKPTKTILGAMIRPHPFEPAPMGEGNGWSLPQICARAGVDVVNYNDVITTRRMMEYLVEAGLLAYDEPPENTAAALLRQDEGGYFGAKYVLAEPTKLSIERIDPEADAARERRIEERVASYTDIHRPSIIGRWRGRRWVKQMRKEREA